MISDSANINDAYSARRGVIRRYAADFFIGRTIRISVAAPFPPAWYFSANNEFYQWEMEWVQGAHCKIFLTVPSLDLTK